MSFSTEVKNELCRVSMQRACCTRAEVYGALLHSSVFSHKEIRLSVACRSCCSARFLSSASRRRQAASSSL